MLTKYEKSLVEKTIRRKTLFKVLSIFSVFIGLGLAIYYAWQFYSQPSFNVGIHFALVILILLNARQNLRQYNFAKILEQLQRDKPA